MPLTITEHSRVGELWGNAFNQVGAAFGDAFKKRKEEEKRISAETKDAEAQLEAFGNKPVQLPTENALQYHDRVKAMWGGELAKLAREKAKQEAEARAIEAQKNKAEIADLNIFRQAVQPIQAPGYGVKSMDMPLRQKTPEEMFGSYVEAGGNNPARMNAFANMAGEVNRRKQQETRAASNYKTAEEAVAAARKAGIENPYVQPTSGGWSFQGQIGVSTKIDPAKKEQIDQAQAELGRVQNALNTYDITYTGQAKADPEKVAALRKREAELRGKISELLGVAQPAPSGEAQPPAPASPEQPKFKKGQRVLQNGSVYEYDGQNWIKV